MYDVEFHDECWAEYSTNVIAESLYSNVDDNGMSYGLISGIIDHRKE